MAQVENSERIRWIDAARGLSMVLVVLWHAALLCSQFVPVEASNQPWIVVGDWLTPMRMPLFFFISGLLSVGAISRPLLASPARTVGIYSIYAGWTLIFLSRLFLPQARDEGEPPPSAMDLVLSAVLPTSFWYLWALAVFFLVAWVFRRVLGRYAVWLIVPAAVLTLFADNITASTAGVLPASMDSLKLGFCAGNFFWYYAGLWGADLWRWIAQRATPTRCGVAVGAYLVAVGISIQVGIFGEVRLLLSATVLFATALFTGLISFTDRVSALLIRIGEATLPVYIFHIFLISVLSAVVGLASLQDALREYAGFVVWAGPPLLTALLMSVSRLLGRVVLATPLSFTLDPKELTRGLGKPRARDAVV